MVISRGAAGILAYKEKRFPKVDLTEEYTLAVDWVMATPVALSKATVHVID